MESESAVEVRFTLSKDELRSALRSIFFRSISTRVVFGLSLLLLVLGAIVVLVGETFGGLEIGAYGLFLLLLLTGVSWLRPARAIRKEVLLSEIVFRFSSDGIEVKSIYSDAKMKWPYLKRVVETDRFFLLYVARSVAHFLPQRAFASEADRATFRELVGRSIAH